MDFLWKKNQNPPSNQSTSRGCAWAQDRIPIWWCDLAAPPWGDPWRGAWKDVTYQIWRKLCSFVHRFHHDQETHAHTYKLEVIIHNKNTQLLFLDFWCCAIWNGVAEVYIWQQVSGSKTLDVQSGFHRWGWEWGAYPSKWLILPC